MIKLEDAEIRVPAIKGDIAIRRNDYGVPIITAESFVDALYGLGLVQAHDRGMQMELARLAAQGRLSEHLPASEDLVAMDVSMRRYDLWRFARRHTEHLDGEIQQEALAFCKGVNDQFTDNPPQEFGLIGYQPEPWMPADCLAIAKLIVLIDMDETQGWIKRVIVQMVQSGISVEMLKEMFVYMIEDPGPDYLAILRQVKMPAPYVPASVKWALVPRLRTSSHWMVSGRRTLTGKPILAGSPELDTARLPAIWQEVVLRVGGFYCIGVFVPGLPTPALGRTNNLSWSATYACMDAMDYFIEEVKAGTYRRRDRWIPFTLREEVIKVKGGEPRAVRFYENEHGVLDAEPEEDGYYLCLAMSMRDAGAQVLPEFTQAYRSRTVAEAMEHLARVDCMAFNWGLADSAGNIGYQMSGRCPIRPEGWRGFLPLPGWDGEHDWQGFYGPEKHPRLLNPAAGYFMTSNQDLNYLTDVHIQSMPLSEDRASRIAELLAARADHSVERAMKMQYEVYGKHAEWFMGLIRPLLPDTEKGRLLKDWDLCYSSESLGASLFESVYLEVVKTVFGDYGMGREVVAFIMEDSELFNMYYGQFDRVLQRADSLWFGGKSREDVFGEAIARGLQTEPTPFGATRKVMMKNIVYGELAPQYNYGPIEIIGCRGTVSQGAIFKAPGGRIATFSPTIRFVADLSGDDYYSCLAGGPCEQPTSKWYTSGVEDWVAGRYKLIRGAAQ
jgi:penicillin amidase